MTNRSHSSPLPLRSPVICLVTAAMFAAIITLTTAYLFHIPIGTAGGYIHIGDAFISLAACFLPLPYAMAAAAVGAGMADLLSGAAIWMVPSLLIKAALVPAFPREGKLFCRRSILAVLLGCIITPGGYYLAEGILTGSWVVPLASIPMNLFQGAANGLLFLIMASALDRSGVPGRLRGC